MCDSNGLKACAEIDEAVERSALVTREEARLLACARAGDAAAFGSLVMPHRDAIFRVTRRILRNPDDAEDAVQTAFLEALRHLDSFQGRSQFSSWLTRIAMNAAFMRLRTSRRKSETSLDEMIQGVDRSRRLHLAEARPTPEQEYSAKEVRGLLDKALDRLGPLYVEILHMRDIEELSAKEAARILGVPVGTVKARLHRARARLTQHVQVMLVPKRRPRVVKNRRAGAFVSREALRA